MSNVMLISDNWVCVETHEKFIFSEIPKVTSYQCFPSVGEAVKTEIDPDLILIDYRLGFGKYGPNYIPELRRRFPNAKIVGYSVDDSSWSDFMDAEADGFISKILRNEQLYEKIGAFLEE